MPRFAEFAVPVLVAAVLGTVVFSEQVVKPTERPDRVKVTYWEKWTGGEYDGIKAIVDDFNRSQNRIYVELLSISDIGNKTLLSVSAGVPPDIAGLWGENIPQYADDRAIEPLDDLAKEFGIRESDYIPAYWDLSTYDGKLYGLCSTPASTALHYNTEMLASVGVKEPPQTFEEMDALADRLTIKDGSNLKRAGFLPAEPGWWNFGWGYFFGGRLWDGDKKILIDSPENVRAYRWVQSYSKKYGPSEVQTFRSGFGNFSSPQNAFLSEKVAMQIQGVWMNNYVEMYAPKLKWAAAPFPHPADRPDLANLTFAGMDVLCIPRGAKHKREAFEFIAYVQSQKAMEKLCLLHQKNSPLAQVSEEFFRKHRNPYIRLFDELARGKTAVIVPQIGMWPEMNAELSNAFDEVGLMRKSPEQALKDCQVRVQDKWDQYRMRLEARRAAGR